MRRKEPREIGLRSLLMSFWSPAKSHWSGKRHHLCCHHHHQGSLPEKNSLSKNAMIQNQTLSECLTEVDKSSDHKAHLGSSI